MNIFVPKTYKPKWKPVPLAKEPRPWEGKLSNSVERSLRAAGIPVEMAILPHPIPYDYEAFFLSLIKNPLDLRFVRDEPKHIHLPLQASIRKG